MLIFRWMMVLLFLAVVASLVLYAATGQVRYRRIGLAIMKWTVLAALGFFAVLVAERLF